MRKKPTILFINRVYPSVRGATGRLLKDLAETFARSGWHVTVISSGSIAGEERKNGVRIIRAKANTRPRGIFMYLWIWVKMLIIALRLKPRDVLVTMSDPPLIIVAGVIIAKFKKCRHLNWCQDVYPDIVPALGINMPVFLMKWFRSLRIRAMKSCDTVIVCGRCMMKRLVLDGVNAQKIEMVANWPDPELVNPSIVKNTDVSYSEVDKKSVRPFENQVKNDKRFRVLYAGNIGLAHPIDVVLDAAKIFDDQGSDIEFVFVGDGIRFDYVSQRRSDMCLNNVRLLPYQPSSRLQDIMESGDIHLITMSDDSLGFIVPSKTYSAIAVARPCVFVGPKSSEVARVISDYTMGFIVAQDDVANLVSAISCLRNSKDTWLKAHRGALRAREEFTPKASMDKWVGLVNDIVKKDLAKVAIDKYNKEMK